jgi:hypothetical protein
MRRRLLFSFIFCLIFSSAVLAQPEKLTFDAYHQPGEVNTLLKAWTSGYPQLTKLFPIGKSAEQREFLAIRVACSGKGLPDPEHRPAVFVSANLEGYHLVGTEAALLLAEKLLIRYSSDENIKKLLDNNTVYIAPVLNPDVAQAYFSEVRYERRRNGQPIDEDLDDRLDEDGFDDLNRDGVITQMRVKDPEGKWISDPTEPRLMRQADPQKGETGIYKIYTEGLDNDGDGSYNEDPPGGIELNRNFPHDFEYFDKTTGLWPVSAGENIALMDFLLAHPNINLVLNFSTENTFLNLQQTGRAQASGDSFQVPQPYADFLGLDPNERYTMQQLIDILKGLNIGGGIEINESLVAQILGLGPAMSLDQQDLPVIQAVQKDYKDVLKEGNLEGLEKGAKGVVKGSFAAYCYFQHGVAVYSSHLWTVPEPEKEVPEDALTKEKLKEMSTEEFLALGEKKITAFLKEQGAPDSVNAGMLIKMVESGKITPARMAEMMDQMPKQAGPQGDEHPDAYILDWSDTTLKGNGFVDWTPFDHPTLGNIEIGGFTPYLRLTPPVVEMAKTIDIHSDFYILLMDKLPRLEIKSYEVKALDEEVFNVTLYLSNSGWFSTSTSQGRRARTVWPIRVQLELSENQSLFSGRSVVNIPFIGGNGDTRKVEWTVKAKKGSTVTFTAQNPRLNTVTARVVLQ